jgi:ABC-type uncharacterized transport system involved in gliding motility auxiliary subunit
MLNRILGIVGWIGTALVLAAVAMRFLKPAWTYSSWLAWAGLVCVLIYTLGQGREIARMFTRRQARYGTLAIVSVLAVFGILVGINYIGSRENKRWDLSSGHQFSLSDQTRRVVSSLKGPLKISVYALPVAPGPGMMGFEEYRDKLREYEYLSKNVTVDYVDLDKKLAQAKQNQIQTYGTVLFEYQGRTQRVTPSGDKNLEQDLTNGLIKVVTGEQKKVYFTQGHDERDPTASDRAGYSAVARFLGNDNYGVEKVMLAEKRDVPADATVLIAAGPRTDFLPQEIDAMKRYLNKGGKILFLLDPPERPDSPPLTNVTAFLKDWDIDAGRDVVVDPTGSGNDPFVVLAGSYPSHPITEKFRVLTIYPVARSVTPIAGGVQGRNAQKVVETGENYKVETDLKRLMTSGKPEGSPTGRVSVAAAVSAPAPEAPVVTASQDKTAIDKSEAPKPESRITVFGDSDFAANAFLGFQGNRDMFLNAVSWLAQQENLIAPIRPREADDRRITLTDSQQARINWLAILVIPGAIMFAGIYNWWQRR